jgi:hypothetical protein
VRGKALGIAFYEIEKIRSRCLLSRLGLGGGERKYEVVIVVILKVVEQGADIRVAFDDLAFDPVILGSGRGEVELQGVLGLGFGEARWVPRPPCRQNVGRVGDGRHDIYFDGDGTQARVFLPTVGQNARLDDLLYDDGRLDKDV